MSFLQAGGVKDERRLGQRIAHVLGEAVNEIVFAAVRFVRDDDDVTSVGKQWMLAALFVGKEFLNRGEYHAAAGHVEQLRNHSSVRRTARMLHLSVGSANQGPITDSLPGSYRPWGCELGDPTPHL